MKREKKKKKKKIVGIQVKIGKYNISEVTRLPFV